MEVLVTGGDTDLGRTIAEGFRDAGHQRRDRRRAPRRPGGRREGTRGRRHRVRQHRPGKPRRERADSSPITSTPSSTCPPRGGTRAIRAPTPCRIRPRPGATHSTRRCCRQCSPCRSSVITCGRAGRSHRRTRESRRGQCGGGHQGRDIRLDGRAGCSLRHPRHHGECRGVWPKRGTGLRRAVADAAAGGRRDHPARVVPHHSGRPAHHRPDAARQPRCAGELRLNIPAFAES